MRKVRDRLTFANVMSVVAVFFALGGGAYALTSQDKKQVKKIAKQAASKLDKTIELTPGPKGEQGPTGLPGAPGADTGSALLASFGTGSNAVNFASVVGNSSPSATESDVTLLSPNVDLVARDLVMGGPGPIAGGLRIYTLRVNGADTALACQEIAGNNRSCTSPQGVAVPVPARSLLSLKVQATDSGSQRAMVSFRLTED